MFDTSQLFGGTSAAGAFYPTTINQSLRFEDGDSAYLSRTPASAGNRKTFTWSGWVKRGNITASTMTLFGTGAADNGTYIHFTSDYRFEFAHNDLGVFNIKKQTSAVFRDPSAWYHLVVTLDTTDATAENRVKIWVNGERVTNWQSDTDPSLNKEVDLNTANAHNIGRLDTSRYFDGYLAEVHFTDGTAYTADDFGELKSGIWVPKTPSVTYGTNGFKLTFEDSAAIGDDTSGNGNDWTVNNLVASDVVPDSPTNNFATLNPLSNTDGAQYREGNLYIDIGGTPRGLTHSTIGIKSGKWYYEALWISGVPTVGVNAQNTDTGTMATVDGIRYNSSNGNVIIDNVLQATYTAWDSSGTVVGVAINADDDEVSFYRNGTLITTESFTFDKTYFPTVSDTSGSSAGDAILNFGQDSTFAGRTTAGGNTDANGIGDFFYTVPDGALALCTSNLPDPVIDPAQDATPEDHFNVITYTGDGTSSHAITGVNFQPDWVWIKNRSGVYDHHVYDAVRGSGKRLQSNTTNAEATITNGLNSFDSDGFTLGSDGAVNLNTNSYVSWNWKAGGTGVSNTDGSITSTVSANTDAGFSIASYTGTGSQATVGHGLSEAPEMVIIKQRSGSETWVVGHESLGWANVCLDLSSTAASSGAKYVWGNPTGQTPTTTTFGIGTDNDVNNNTSTYIAYCFHSVDGFSKVGSYIGNNSTNGTFVYTGFRPKFIMLKRANSTGGSWIMMDAEREPYNFVENYVLANSSAAEVTTTSASDCDFLSNGIKFRTNAASVNASGDEIIYIAFAESPFKYSNAR
mgnify:CR=1 FL=1